MVTKPATTTLLMVIAVVGVAIGYATSVCAARILGADGFHDYAVAVSSLGLLASLCEAGVGKYALKVWPEFSATRQWSLMAGYLRFSLVIAISMSVLIGFLVVFSVADADGKLYPLVLAAFFLPAVALCGVMVDFVMSNRAAIRGTLIARWLVPATTLGLMLIFSSTTQNMSGNQAVACFGIGSLTGTVIAAIVFYRTSPREAFSAKPACRLGPWLSQGLYFATFAFAASWIFRISILVLEVTPAPELEVARLAAAMDTGCLILLLAKTTDKLFQPLMSIMLQQQDWRQGEKLRRDRYLLIGSVCVWFLAVIYWWGPAILSLYGDQYGDAYLALCLISLGCCVWTLFSLSPAYLHFTGHNRFVLASTLISGIVLAVATAVLGWKYGATGASIAFCAVISGTAIFYRICAGIDFNRRKHQVS